MPRPCWSVGLRVQGRRAARAQDFVREQEQAVEPHAGVPRKVVEQARGTVQGNRRLFPAQAVNRDGRSQYLVLQFSGGRLTEFGLVEGYIHIICRSCSSRGRAFVRPQCGGQDGLGKQQQSSSCRDFFSK